MEDDWKMTFPFGMASFQGPQLAVKNFAGVAAQKELVWSGLLVAGTYDRNPAVTSRVSLQNGNKTNHEPWGSKDH